MGTAFLASSQALRTPTTRALGLVLVCLSLSASLQLAALQLSTSPLTKMLMLSRGLASAALVVDGLALAVAFLWLSSRSKKPTSWPTVIALYTDYLVQDPSKIKWSLGIAGATFLPAAAACIFVCRRHYHRAMAPPCSIDERGVPPWAGSQGRGGTGPEPL